jgi:hypothetical protein
MRSDVLTAVDVKMTVFWDGYSVIWWKDTKASQNLAVSIFKVLFYLDDGNSRFLRNVDTILPCNSIIHNDGLGGDISCLARRLVCYVVVYCDYFFYMFRPYEVIIR